MRLLERKDRRERKSRRRRKASTHSANEKEEAVNLIPRFLNPISYPRSSLILGLGKLRFRSGSLPGRRGELGWIAKAWMILCICTYIYGSFWMRDVWLQPGCASDSRGFELLQSWVYLHLFEWGLLVAIWSPKNVRFELRDPQGTFIFFGNNFGFALLHTIRDNTIIDTRSKYQYFLIK